MENRLKHLFLGGVLALGLAPITAALAEEESVAQVIEPELERREIKTAKIDKENFEIGGFAGIIAIEDFDSSSALGARFAYHLTEDFFVEATYGQASGDLTSFEQLSGGSPLFSDADRDYTWYDLSVGWNLFPLLPTGLPLIPRFTLLQGPAAPNSPVTAGSPLPPARAIACC